MYKRHIGIELNKNPEQKKIPTTKATASNTRTTS